MRINATDRWSGDGVTLFLLEADVVSNEYVAWLNDPLVNRYLESRFVIADLDSTRRFVESALANPSVLFLGIKSRELGRHVGNIKLGPIDRNHRIADIGIMIGDRNAWGRGIAAESIALLVGIACAELGLRKLTAGCYASNAGSARAFSKAGFVLEGRRSAHFILDGQPEDLLLMARFCNSL